MTRRAALSPDALRMCAAAAGVPASAVRETGHDRHHKSDVVYVAAGDDTDAPTHVVKLDLGLAAWDPMRELDALRFAEEQLRDAPGIEPVVAVGAGVGPGFLVTRYRPGRSLRRLFEDAIFAGRDTERAAEGARAVAAWLSRFRAHAGRETGLTAERLLAECAEVVGAEHVLVRRLTRYVAALDPADLARLGRALPGHGDPRPQNFLIDDSGTISALDLESFGWRPLDPDLPMFRFPIELWALRSRVARRRADELWHAFFAAYVEAGASPAISLISYLQRAADRIAWVRTVTRGMPHGPRALLRGVRERRWLAERSRWLDELPDELDTAIAIFSNRL